MIGVYSYLEGRPVKRACLETENGAAQLYAKPVPWLGNECFPARYRDSPPPYRAGWFLVSPEDLTIDPDVYQPAGLGMHFHIGDNREGLIDEFVHIKADNVFILMLHIAKSSEYFQIPGEFMEYYSYGYGELENLAGWVFYSFEPDFICWLESGARIPGSPTCKRNSSDADEGEYAERVNRRKFFTEY
jgi:hypothetical protein